MAVIAALRKGSEEERELRMREAFEDVPEGDAASLRFRLRDGSKDPLGEWISGPKIPTHFRDAGLKILDRKIKAAGGTAYRPRYAPTRKPTKAEREARWRREDPPVSHEAFLQALLKAEDIKSKSSRREAVQRAFELVPNQHAAWLRFRLRKGSTDTIRKVLKRPIFNGTGRLRGMRVLRRKADGKPPITHSTATGNPVDARKPTAVERGTQNPATAPSRSSGPPTSSVKLTDRQLLAGLDFRSFVSAQSALLTDILATEAPDQATSGINVVGAPRYNVYGRTTLITLYCSEFAKLGSAIGLKGLRHQIRMFEDWRRHYSSITNVTPLHHHFNLVVARLKHDEFEDAYTSYLGFLRAVSATEALQQSAVLLRQISEQFGPLFGDEMSPVFISALSGSTTLATTQAAVLTELDRRLTAAKTIYRQLDGNAKWIFAFPKHRDDVMRMLGVKAKGLQTAIGSGQPPMTVLNTLDKIGTVVALALSFLPSAWPVRLAMVVAGMVALGYEVEAYQQRDAAKAVRFIKDHPGAGGIVLALVGLGIDLADAAALLRRAGRKVLASGEADVILQELVQGSRKLSPDDLRDPHVAKALEALEELAAAEKLVKRARPKKVIIGAHSGLDLFLSFTSGSYVDYVAAVLRREMVEFKVFLNRELRGPLKGRYRDLTPEKRAQILAAYKDARRVMTNPGAKELAGNSVTRRIVDIAPRHRGGPITFADELEARVPGHRFHEQRSSFGEFLINVVGPKTGFVTRIKRPDRIIERYDGETYLRYVINDSGTTFRAGNITVNKDIRGQGVSEMLYRKALHDADSDKIVRWTGTLEGTNRAKYLEVRRPVNAGGKGMNHVDALKETPAFKTRTKLGFDEISPMSKKDPGLSWDAGKKQWINPPDGIELVTMKSRRVEWSPRLPPGAASAIAKAAPRVTRASKSAWKKGLQRRRLHLSDVAENNRGALKYERAVAGRDNYLIESGGTKVWADGVNMAESALVEAKFIKNPQNSAFIKGSKASDYWRFQKITPGVFDEFTRYAKVINDPATPVNKLIVYTSDARAIEYFEGMMKYLELPGEIRVKTVGQLLADGKLRGPI